MRTRFVNIDYFNSPAPAKTLDDFLRLPLSHHLPLPPPCSPDEHQVLHSTGEEDVSDLVAALHNLPIDTALSRFYSDVIPHFINADPCCSPQFTSDPETGTTIYGKDGNLLDLIQFEMPELDLSLGNVCITKNEALQMISEVSEAETDEDVFRPIIRMQNLRKIQESLFAVENISMEYNVDQKVDLLEDGGSMNCQHSPCSDFPLLEEDVLTLEIFSSISVENELLLLENIEPQQLRGKDEIMIGGKELLQFMEFDILDYLLAHSLPNQCADSDTVCPIFFQEIDLLSIIEHSPITENMSLYHGNPDDNSMATIAMEFEELRFFDKNSSQNFELFSNTAPVLEAETCQQMFCEASKFRNFNELIVIHELTLVDDSFKSLPVPILSHHGKMRSLPEYIEETLAELKPQPSFSSDAIYLDWHILEGKNCNNGNYSCSLKALEELDTCVIDFDLSLFDGGMLVFDLIFSSDCPNILNTKEKKEILNLPSGDISMVCERLNETSISLLNDGYQNLVKGEALCKKVPPLHESMSHFDDLDFFLNPLEAAKKNHRVAKPIDVNTTFPSELPSASSSAGNVNVVQLQQWNIKLHEIMLSDDILALIDELRKNYLTIINNDTELRKTTFSNLPADDLTLLSIPKEKLMNCIRETSSKRTPLAYLEDTMMVFITLYAIKQMAWYLCYYGIHSTYLYIDELYRVLPWPKFRLSSLQTLMLDALEKLNNEMTKSHPSLSVIHEILQSNFRQSRLKVLIVAERVLWCSLKSLLTSIGIVFINPHTSARSQLDVDYDYRHTDTVMSAMLYSDCCLISFESITASFPFKSFGMFLEYGGSHGSSRLCTISHRGAGSSVIHFLKVDLEDSSVSKALCGSVCSSIYDEVRMEGDPHSVPVLSESYRKLEELLNFMPIDEYNRSVEAPDIVKPYRIHSPVHCISMDSTQISASMPSFPDAIIIMNTQSVDSEMIISRRSTYQRILALEKEGTQVVERDLNLPVDVIISAVVCLVWYDFRNIGKKATTPNEASSSLPLCVENIAANVLTSLSFTFNGCVLIFEGESSFLTGIMESSDELYAAAASLGIDLQLFCSYSFEMTDEIILSCIGHATNSSRGIYPKMPESETLAESFLTTFPSINPLSAHAILSSAGVFIKYLEWSHDHRVNALKKYQVPDESVTLLSAFLRFGEREDCKSGMTDCSSSVSSAPDSVNCLTKSVSEMRKRKYANIPTDEMFHFEPSKFLVERTKAPTKMAKPYNSWLSEGPDVFYEVGNSNVAFEDKFFAQNLGSKTNMKTTPSRLSKSCIQMSKSHVVPAVMGNRNVHGKNAPFSQDQRLDTATIIQLDESDRITSGRQRKDIIGEVINIDDTCPSVEYSIANSLDFSHLLDETERDPAVRYSRTARKLSFGNSSSLRTTYPTAAEISCESDAGERKFHPDEGVKKDVFLEQKDLFEEDTLLKAVRNPPSFLEKDIPHYGGTPLKNAIRFPQPQKGSPWTIEFLNRVREKSKLRQQSLPQDLAASYFGHSGNISSTTKRKCPSILDFYKYQRGNTPNRITEQKRQKRSVQPSSSSKKDKENIAPSLNPEVTPIDKRARQQRLSFVTSGSGGQGKLVWGDKTARNLKRQF